MTVKKLKLPLLEKDVRRLNLRDSVCLDGRIYTCRSQFQLRAIEQNILPPIDFEKNNVMFHMGGIMKKEGSQWRAVSLLATSSIRFEKLGAPIIRKLRTRAIIGKGTMGQETMRAMQEVGCVHLAWGGLMGNLLAQRVKRVVAVYDLEALGALEATWVLEVEDFGPFIVDIDTKGNNLFHEVNEQVDKNIEAAQSILSGSPANPVVQKYPP